MGLDLGINSVVFSVTGELHFSCAIEVCSRREYLN